MKKHPNYLLWTELPYAGEKASPQNPVEPLAGSWPLFYLKRGPDGKFLYPAGKVIKLDVRNPNTIDWEHQLDLVQKKLTNLTKQQIRIARYWGTGVPTKQWAPIIDRLTDHYSVNPPRAGRIFAATYAGINDALVATWYLKYHYLVARPDQYDQSLAPILCTPRFPTYTSGHAAVAGCASVILSYFFPAEAARLNSIAYEVALSRFYAGVHFLVDNFEGLKLGRQIGRIAVNVLKNQKNSLGQPVDIPYAIFKHANYPPPPYKQLIPFDFDAECTSLVESFVVTSK